MMMALSGSNATKSLIYYDNIEGNQTPNAL